MPFGQHAVVGLELSPCQPVLQGSGQPGDTKSMHLHHIDSARIRPAMAGSGWRSLGVGGRRLDAADSLNYYPAAEEGLW